MTPQGNLKPTDWVLFAITLGLVVFGLVMVYSASFIYAQEKTGDGFSFIVKQLAHAGAGLVLMYTVSRVDFRKWQDWAYPALISAVLLLILVKVPGVGARVGGAQRWIRLAGFNFQPAEFAKLALVLFVARQLTLKKDRLEKFSAGVVSNFLAPLPAFLLLLSQPDFGSVVMIGVSIFLMMFLAGVPLRYLLGVIGAGGGIAAALIFSSPYRMARVVGFLDPWKDPAGKGFQVLQSLLGLHNGALFGVGLGNGKEKLFYLPEAHNDFIFAVIGEELGFLGILGVVLAFLFLIYRGMRVGWNAFNSTGDRFTLYLAAGVTTLLGAQAFTNMAVALGLLPTKGLALPFISYGGSSLLMNFLAVGVLMSLARSSKA